MPGKWIAQNIPEGETISADAVTADLKTTGNALSTWACALDESDVKEVALAFASTINRPDKMCFVLLSRKALEDFGIQVNQTDGDTAVSDLAARHHDLIELGLVRLGRVAELIADRARRNECCYVFTKEQYCQLVCGAIGENRLTIFDLKDDFQKEIRKRMFSPPD